VKQALNSNGVEINEKSQDDRTPLYVACWKNHVNVVKILLEQEQLRVNQADEFGLTPLHRACIEGHVDIVRLLLDHRNIDITLQDKKSRRTAEKWAREAGFVGIVQLFKGL
jgi:ankyrin repeat protein